jgi:hypothetical protein
MDQDDREVRLSIRELRELVQKRAVYDREGLAQELGVCVRQIDRLRRLPGFPELRVGSAPRFELEAVLSFLRSRRGGLRVVAGGSR